MKLFFILTATLALSASAFAQPVIQDGSNVPTPGFSAPFSTGVATSGVGNPGANQVWDFSSIPFTQIATLSIINPSTSPFASSFPSSNHAYSYANAYVYFEVSASRMEVLSHNAGSARHSNPKTVLIFPFHFGDTASDTWQKDGSSPEDIRLTYDGYGTLITPTTTYQNVVRVKESYGDYDDYHWWTLNPLLSILSYNGRNNTFYWIGAPGTVDAGDVFSGSSELRFDTVAIGAMTMARLKVYNTRAGSEQITAMQITGQDAAAFSIVPPSSNITIGAGDSIDVSIRFSPASEGAKSGVLTLATTQGDRTIVLLGYGKAASSVNEFMTGIGSASITPNPFSTSATVTIVSSVNSTSQNTEFVLYDILGQVVRRLKFQSSSFQLESGSLPGGLYFYKVISNEKVIHSGTTIIE